VKFLESSCGSNPDTSRAPFKDNTSLKALDVAAWPIVWASTLFAPHRFLGRGKMSNSATTSPCFSGQPFHWLFSGSEHNATEFFLLRRFQYVYTSMTLLGTSFSLKGASSRVATRSAGDRVNTLAQGSFKAAKGCGIRQVLNIVRCPAKSSAEFCAHRSGCACF
jgi:hypothetical protein